MSDGFDVVRRVTLDVKEPLSRGRSGEAELLEARGGNAPLGIRMLHPGVLFALVWGVGLGGWLLASPEWFLRVAATEKHISARAVVYFAACIGMFLFGGVVGPALLRANERPVGILPQDLTSDEADGFRRKTYIWFGIGSVCALYLLAAGTLRFGGVSALVGFLSSGGSVEQLAQVYFEPTRKAGVTVWIHALVAVGPLTTIAAALTKERATARRLVVANISGFLLVVLVSLAFAERLIAFGYVVASLVAWVGVLPWARRRSRSSALSGAQTAARIVLVGALVAGLWIGGEFSRTYLSTREAETPLAASDVAASVPLAVERFFAYVTTSVNNGMYAVDNARERSLVFNIGAAFVTAGGLDNRDAPLVGAAIVERDEMLWRAFPYHTPLTTFSMPGDVFQDIGWIGPVLIFWFGVLAGCVYARFRRGELWALLVYPLVVAGILDSYRILYWTRTEMVVPVLVISLVCMGLYRSRRATRGSFSTPQSTPISAR